MKKLLTILSAAVLAVPVFAVSTAFTSSNKNQTYQSNNNNVKSKEKDLHDIIKITELGEIPKLDPVLISQKVFELNNLNLKKYRISIMNERKALAIGQEDYLNSFVEITFSIKDSGDINFKINKDQLKNEYLNMFFKASLIKNDNSKYGQMAYRIFKSKIENSMEQVKQFESNQMTDQEIGQMYDNQIKYLNKAMYDLSLNILNVKKPQEQIIEKVNTLSNEKKTWDLLIKQADAINNKEFKYSDKAFNIFKIKVQNASKSVQKFLDKKSQKNIDRVYKKQANKLVLAFEKLKNSNDFKKNNDTKLLIGLNKKLFKNIVGGPESQKIQKKYNFEFFGDSKLKVIGNGKYNNSFFEVDVLSGMGTKKFKQIINELDNDGNKLYSLQLVNDNKIKVIGNGNYNGTEIEIDYLNKPLEMFNEILIIPTSSKYISDQPVLKTSFETFSDSVLQVKKFLETKRTGLSKTEFLKRKLIKDKYNYIQNEVEAWSHELGQNEMDQVFESKAKELLHLIR